MKLHYYIAAVLLILPLAATAGEKKDEKKLDEEWDLQEESDYPDLVGVDDESEVMDEFAFLQEEDIVFTAAKHKQKAGFSPSAVVVIRRQEIQESGAITLLELLRRYPAVNVYMFDPLYPTAEIRGSLQVLVLLDGREVNLELFVSPFFAITPVTMHEIERIEIVLGPNSALYGANAVSAVINIITRQPGHAFHADLFLAAGEHGTSIVEGLVEGGAGPVSLQGSFRIDRADSWMVRDTLAKSVMHANCKARLDLPGGSLSADGGVLAASGRVFSLMGYMDFLEVRHFHTKIDLELGSLKARAYWYGIRNISDVDMDLTHADLGITLATIPTLHLNADTLQAEAQYDFEPFENNLLIAGVDFRFNSYRSEQITDPVIEEFRAGFFLHDEHRFADRILMTLGARIDWNSKTDLAVSPRAALVYNPAGEHFLRASAGTGFRKPTLLESSVNVKVDANPAFATEMTDLFEVKGISNPDLDNLIITAVELGYRGALLERALRLGADAYLGLYRSWISFRTDIRFRPPPFQMQIDVDNSQIGYDNRGDENNIIGINFFIEGEILEELTLFLRGELRHKWLIKDNSRHMGTPRLLAATGGTLRLFRDLIIHLAFVYVDGKKDSIRDPESSLAPARAADLPPRAYLLSALTYRLQAGASHLELGLTLFNPFGGSFREKIGIRARDGSNYGGEFIGTRAMLTARFLY
jgi:hypothetical protein